MSHVNIFSLFNQNNGPHLFVCSIRNPVRYIHTDTHGHAQTHVHMHLHTHVHTHTLNKRKKSAKKKAQVNQTYIGDSLSLKDETE